MVSSVEAITPTLRSIARIRSGRHRRRFQPALDAFAVYQDLVAHLDERAIRDVIENRGIVTRSDPTLYELWCLFNVIDALTQEGWDLDPLGVFGGKVRLTGHRDDVLIDVVYQEAPKKLRLDSGYVEPLKRHGFTGVADLIPDIVLRLHDGGTDRWLVIEAKMGTEAGLGEYCRRALSDLLGYQQAFATALADCEVPIGLGIAWGASLVPQPGALLLCTPDHIPEAVAMFTDSAIRG